MHHWDIELMANPPRSLHPRRARRLAVVGGPQQPVQTAQAAPSTFRLLLVWGVLAIGAGLLAVNLFYIQIKQAPVLQKIARDQQQLFVRPFVPRRQIVDRTGTVLAVDRPVYSLFAHPKLFKEPKAAIATKLATILSRPAADILKKLNEAESGIRLEYALTEDAAERIQQLAIEGLERVQFQQRLYPQHELMAGIVGYVDADHHGQAGVELSQQNLLERSVKVVRLTRMGDGSLMPDQVPGGFLNIDDLQLHLTVDSRLQRVSTAILKQQMKAFEAKRGTVIVMNVQDGSLLALVTEPSYDPNQYYKFPLDRYKNWAMTDLYEPGSTFKPINVAIALDAKAIQPDSVVDDEGSITIDSWPINNSDGMARGPISITEVLEHSSNVGMVRIVQQMQPSVYYQWLKRIGLGESVGIDLPSEVAGQFKDLKTFTGSPIEPATTSFGQGFSLTPIQLAQLQAALANGGRLVTPHVVRGLFDSKGMAYWKPNFPPPRPVFSKASSQAVLSMMESVVTEGTGKPAQIPGYRVGGKTGTAQKANPDGGYYENARITSFVGVVPIEAPRFVVVAVVDEPLGSDAYGSTVAAPIVKDVMEALITIEKISPSRSVTRSAPSDAST